MRAQYLGSTMLAALFRSGRRRLVVRLLLLAVAAIFLYHLDRLTLTTILLLALTQLSEARVARKAIWRALPPRCLFRR